MLFRSQLVGDELAKNIAKGFVNGKYDGGRHQILTLRCLAMPARPLVNFATTASLPARTSSKSMRGSAKYTPFLLACFAYGREIIALTTNILCQTFDRILNQRKTI